MNVELSSLGKDYEFIKKCLTKIQQSQYEMNEDLFLKDLQPLYNYQHSRHEREEIQLTSLKRFINSLKQEEKYFYLNDLIRFIAGLALMEGQVWPKQGPKYLISSKQDEVTFTKREVSIILANMYLLSTPRRYDEYPNTLPDPCTKVCFDYLFYLPGFGKAKQSKLLCIYTYFKAIFFKKHDENYMNLQVTIQRLQVNPDFFKQSDNSVFGEIELNEKEKIEDYTEFECIHTDFANEYIGGKVLIDGNVQEEILFSICPEMLVSLMVCQKMLDQEAIMIIGAEKFCTYTGYGIGFTFTGEYKDIRPIDTKLNRMKTYTTCIDATHLLLPPQIKNQYSQESIVRELVKCLTGFQEFFEEKSEKNNQKMPLITGNWGCGMYNGDVHLKLLVQWIACSFHKRKMIYCTFEEQRLKNEIDFVLSLQGRNINYILKLIFLYNQTKKTESLYSFMKKNMEE